jgi:Zn-dependent peptidase ImmA (M78 family)
MVVKMSLYIYETVEKLKRKYKTNNPFTIAKALNIFVSFKALNNLKGFYYIVNRERHIVINNALGEEEQRIVCAHELGHDRLHQHFARVNALKDFVLYDMSSKPEYEANLFAVDLLMDDGKVRELIQQNASNFVARALQVHESLVDYKVESMRKREVL